MLLDRRGWPTRQLGADTPTPSIVAAADTTGAQAAVVTAHQVSLRSQALQALRALSGSGDVQLFYAGAAFDNPAARRAVPGTYLGEVLPEAADVLEAALVMP